jgi:DNA-directed RNA polymerase specialized sigma24 family protein
MGTELCSVSYAGVVRLNGHSGHNFSPVECLRALLSAALGSEGGAILKADVSVRSCDEIAAAIRALSDAQWIRLRKASGYFAWVYDLSGEDLLQEAYCRALAGSRQCPTHVDIVKFLKDAMRSIANGEGEKAENQIDTISVEECDAAAGGALQLKDSADSEEEIMVAAEANEATRQAVLGLFPNDAQARDLADGILAGYEGEELRALTDLDKTGYASKRKFMRRTFDKHSSEGKKP